MHSEQCERCDLPYLTQWVSLSFHMGMLLRLTKCRPRINPVYNARSVSTAGFILKRNLVVASVARLLLQ